MTLCLQTIYNKKYFVEMVFYLADDVKSPPVLYLADDVKSPPHIIASAFLDTGTLPKHQQLEQDLVNSKTSIR